MKFIKIGLVLFGLILAMKSYAAIPYGTCQQEYRGYMIGQGYNAQTVNNDESYRDELKRQSELSGLFRELTSADINQRVSKLKSDISVFDNEARNSSGRKVSYSRAMACWARAKVEELQGYAGGNRTTTAQNTSNSRVLDYASRLDACRNHSDGDSVRFASPSGRVTTRVCYTTPKGELIALPKGVAEKMQKKQQERMANNSTASSTVRRANSAVGAGSADSQPVPNDNNKVAFIPSVTKECAVYTKLKQDHDVPDMQWFKFGNRCGQDIKVWYDTLGNDSFGSLMELSPSEEERSWVSRKRAMRGHGGLAFFACPAKSGDKDVYFDKKQTACFYYKK